MRIGTAKKPFTQQRSIQNQKKKIKGGIFLKLIFERLLPMEKFLMHEFEFNLRSYT